MVLICSCRLKFLTRILFGKKVKPYKKDSPEPFQLKIEDKQLADLEIVLVSFYLPLSLRVFHYSCVNC